MIRKIKNSLILILLCYFVVTTTILNWANRVMVPVPVDPIAQDSEIYTEYYEQNSEVYLQRYQTRLNLKADILAHRPSQPLEFIEGDGSYVQINRKQEDHHYVIHVKNDAVIRENTYYFPGWTLFVNGKISPINYENNNKDSFGKITFPLKRGLYKIDVMLLDTPIRSLAKNISFFTFLGSILYILFFLIRKLCGLARKKR